MPETWIGWAAWAYLFIGLGFAARMWHEMKTEEEFETFRERHGANVDPAVMRKTWIGSLGLFALFMVALWPLDAAHEVRLLFRYRIPTWRTRMKNRKLRRRAERLVREIDEIKASRR